MQNGECLILHFAFFTFHSIDPPFYRGVAQSSERPAWDREAAGGNPAVPTILKLLPWSNTSGIRLLSGTMQVGVLPAAPINHCQVVSK